jgi:hypothetical protein
MLNWMIIPHHLATSIRYSRTLTAKDRSQQQIAIIWMAESRESFSVSKDNYQIDIEVIAGKSLISPESNLSSFSKSCQKAPAICLNARHIEIVANTPQQN